MPTIERPRSALRSLLAEDATLSGSCADTVPQMPRARAGSPPLPLPSPEQSGPLAAGRMPWIPAAGSDGRVGERRAWSEPGMVVTPDVLGGAIELPRSRTAMVLAALGVIVLVCIALVTLLA
jgi:hypothetical protein